LLETDPAVPEFDDDGLVEQPRATLNTIAAPTIRNFRSIKTPFQG